MRLAAAALLVVAAACAGSQQAPRRAAPLSTSLPPGAADGVSPPASRAGPAHRPATGSPGARAATAAPHTSEPPGPNPPQGRYRYHTELDVPQSGVYTGTRTLSYFPPQDGGRQLVYQTTQAGGGGEKPWWFQYRWAASGLYREKEAQPSGTYCVYDPPLLWLRFPLAVGVTWRSSSDCPRSSLRFTVEGSVERVETVDVGGTPVQAFVVRRSVSSGSTRAPATPTPTPTPRLETEWFSWDLRIFVRLLTQGTAASGGYNLRDVLQSLQPEPLPDVSPPRGF